jgi:hypothetical protein
MTLSARIHALAIGDSASMQMSKSPETGRGPGRNGGVGLEPTPSADHREARSPAGAGLLGGILPD